MLCSVENWESHWHGWWARVGGEGLWLERGFFLVPHYLIRENYWIYRVSQRTPSLAAKILVSHPLLGALPLGCEASVLLGNLWLGQFRMVLWYGLSYLSFFLLGISVCSPENISLSPETVQAPRATQSATNPKLATVRKMTSGLGSLTLVFHSAWRGKEGTGQTADPGVKKRALLESLPSGPLYLLIFQRI